MLETSSISYTIVSGVALSIWTFWISLSFSLSLDDTISETGTASLVLSEEDDVLFSVEDDEVWSELDGTSSFETWVGTTDWVLVFLITVVMTFLWAVLVVLVVEVVVVVVVFFVVVVVVFLIEVFSPRVTLKSPEFDPLATNFPAATLKAAMNEFSDKSYDDEISLKLL